MTSRNESALPMRFWVIWSGQVVTIIGNAVLRFAFVIRAWASGEQATRVVLLALCATLPQLLLSPTAGALVDRCRKRTALQLADLGGLVAVGLLTAVYFSGHLQLWQLYATLVLIGSAAAFQYPALSSAVPLLVAKGQYQRANGLLSTATSIASICGPALAGVLIATSGIGLILCFDLATFVIALISVLLARLPEPRERGDGKPAPRRRLGADSVAGLRYLFARPSMRGLILMFFTVNLVMVFGFAVVQPMVLARTGGDAAALASVLASIGIGGVLGGLLLGVWGGPKNRVRGMVFGVIGMCLTAQLGMALTHSVFAWCVAILLGALIMPIVNGAVQSIIQTKVPGDQQGRVFGALMFVAQLSSPLAMAFAGPLADHVFTPNGTASGLVALLAHVVGTGPGAGMASMLLIAGVCGIIAALAGLSSASVRGIDVLMPDLDTASPSPSASADTEPASTQATAR